MTIGRLQYSLEVMLVVVIIAIRTMAAARAAAIAAFQMISSREDHVWSFHVVIFNLKRWGVRRGLGRAFIHASYCRGLARYPPHLKSIHDTDRS